MGYGQHADYAFGWEGDSLQRAMQVCTGEVTDCSTLTVQETDATNSCKQGTKVPEITEGQWADIEKLPGCNPLQGGPEPATAIINCNAPSTTTLAPVPTQTPAPVIPPWTVCNPGSVTQNGVPFAGPSVTPPSANVTGL